MTTKILTFILSTIIGLKIILWFVTDAQISRSSLLVLTLLIILLNVKNRFTWVFAILFFIVSVVLIFTDFSFSQSGPNPFLFLESIIYSLHLETNRTIYLILQIFPLVLYLFLFIVFLFPSFRKRYLEKTARKSLFEQ